MNDFSLLKTFEVDPKFGSFLNRKFEEYRSSHPPWTKDDGFNISGYQTPNLLSWDDKEYQNFIVSDVDNLICKYVPCVWDYHYIHFLDYDKGGRMELHNHKEHEDFVLFIYLKTCQSGQTVFYLNDLFPERTTISVTPKENLGAVFSAMVDHEGLHTKEHKRIFVCGIKMLNTIT